MKKYFLLTLIFVMPLTSFRVNHSINSPCLNEIHNVEIQCFANGSGHAGQVAFLKIKNLSGQPQTINIPSGSLMKNLDTNYQDILIPKPIVLNLKPYQSLTVPTEGYCCKLRGKTPNPKNKFVFMRQTPNKLLRDFVDFFNSQNDSISHSDFQTMIWCLSDMQNPAGIPMLSEKNFKYKKWICQARNLPLPWYIIKQKKFILNDGRIHLINDSLIGEFVAVAKNDGYETFVITDDKGNEVFYAQTNKLIPGNNNIKLNLKITQWPKGTYFLTAKTEKNVFLKKQIDI